MNGWIFIFLSSGCAVIVAHLLKYIEFRKLNTLRVLTVNYLIATIVAFSTPGRSPGESGAEILTPVLVLAVIVGIFFIANYFTYSKSVYHNGVGISVAAMRISLIIPVLLSTLWYHEYLAVREWGGILLVFITLYLLLPRNGNKLEMRARSSGLLILLFLLTGLGDASLKIFEVDFSWILTKEQFLGCVFLMAFLTGLAIITMRGNLQYNPLEWLLGAAISLPNLYSAVFLINALSLLNGAIVYTATNLLTVIGATLIGVLWWRDRLTRRQWTGMILTVISILLLV